MNGVYFFLQIFHVVSLKAMYTEQIPTLVNSLVSPINNVATVKMSAKVIKGVSRSKNALLNGDVKNYDWDTGYTCHQLGSGDIVIQLGQPYHIGSMRLLLWDCDERVYSLYIETSTNQKHWDIAVDKRNEQLRSWQSFTFNPRPVVFIKIVGTFNTANEVCLSYLFGFSFYMILRVCLLFVCRFFIVFTLSVQYKSDHNNNWKPLHIS